MSRWNRVTLLAALDERLTQLGYRSPLVLPTNPFDIAAKEGIVISYKPLLDDSLAGWIFKGEHTSTIVLNEYTKSRWVFTLMHELIHYWFHPCGMYYDRTGDSGLCDTQADYAAVEDFTREAPRARSFSTTVTDVSTGQRYLPYNGNSTLKA